MRFDEIAINENIEIGNFRSCYLRQKLETYFGSFIQWHTSFGHVVFCGTDYEIKPAKHLQLWIALKNLCSKKVVNILNHLGHCVSYNVALELETELTYIASKGNLLIPPEFKLSSHIATGIAFDNYDRFVETHNGKDTLHDTVGIIYQNVTSGKIELRSLYKTFLI